MGSTEAKHQIIVAVHEATFINETDLAVTLYSPCFGYMEVDPNERSDVKYKGNDICQIARIGGIGYGLPMMRRSGRGDRLVGTGKYVVSMRLVNEKVEITLSHNARQNLQVTNQSSRKVTLFMEESSIVVDSKVYNEYKGVKDISTDLGIRINYYYLNYGPSYLCDGLIFTLSQINATTTKIIITEKGG